MPVDPTCVSLDAVISGLGACWTDARGQLLAALEIIHDSLNCSDDACNPQRSCVRQVQTNIPPELFIQYGWGGTVPSSFDCPILYVVRGCEVWIGVNSPLCNLYTAASWCQVCAGATQARANARDIITNTEFSVLFPPGGTYTTPKNRPWSAIQVLNGGFVSIGADTFTLPAGDYYITCEIMTHVFFNPTTTEGHLESRLQDLTNNLTIKQMQRIIMNSSTDNRSNQHQFCRAYVQISGTPIAFAVQTYFSATGGGTALDIRTAGNDEVLIEVV